MTEKIDGIKHPKDTHVHIPSMEEAGYEEGNERIQAREPQMLEQNLSSVH